MNIRQRKKLLWSAAVLVGLASLGVVLAGWLWPLRINAALSDKLLTTLRGGGGPDKAGTTRTRPPARLDLAELAQLAARDIRRPLSGPDAASGASPSAALTVQLVGTMQEPGHSMALLKKGDGTFAVCAVGESVDDVGGPAVVTRIDPDRISVQYAGAIRELIIPPTPTVVEGQAP